MISLSKLITLVLIVAAVWYGFKWIRHYRALQARRSGAVPPSHPVRPHTGTEDMVRCPACGIYVPNSAPRCRRPDCPRIG